MKRAANEKVSQAVGQRSRHHRDSLTSDSPETTHITLLETNPCLVQYCMKGRECIVENDEPKCVCQRRCPTHKRTVCGSDGEIYSNHCELHRAACLKSAAVTAVRGTFCVKLGK
ncbi:hypothetical protein NQ317_013164 [Molorchus minor]|uniref:Kazal-like domain-containing protein n=1 Tax=Molorchus minor TaxID=1323400 RepID=A0ABQ9JXV3_9CUCU|nr:hypothetical protein NQ317_013164 [Molorchus minor]